MELSPIDCHCEPTVVLGPYLQTGIDVLWLISGASSNSNQSRALEHVGRRRGGG